MEYVDITADDTKEIILMATNACNLKCKYCYETNKNAPSMHLDRLMTQLEYEIRDNSIGFKRFVVNFHGGEPFLAFEKIKSLVEWIKLRFSDLNITFTTTTNGTILSDEIKEWLLNHKTEFIPILSLDGNKEIHDRNRGNSFDKIDKKFFSDNWPNQGIKMTVSPNTIDDMFNSFVYLYNIGFYPNPTLAREVDWNLDIYLPIYVEELKKLSRFYIEHPKVKPGQLLNLPLHKFSPEYVSKHFNSCGAGFNTIAFDIYGNRYPCQTFITDLKKGYDETEMTRIFSTLKKNCNLNVSPKCEGCSIINWCSPCYGINYSNRGDMGSFDSNMCVFNKVTLLCSAQMFSEIYSNSEKYSWINLEPSELFHSIKGIKHIFELANQSLL